MSTLSHDYDIKHTCGYYKIIVQKNYKLYCSWYKSIITIQKDKTQCFSGAQGEFSQGRNLLSQWWIVLFNSIDECRFGGPRIVLLEPLIQHLSETVIRNATTTSFNCSKASMTEWQHDPYVHPLATHWQQNPHHHRQSRRIVRCGVCCWSSSRWTVCTSSTSIYYNIVIMIT